MKIKTGIGFDVHKFTKGEFFTLGGIDIPFEKSCIAHSDGDVLIHAICDALLGALSMRDIGYHFSDKDPEYKDIDSKILLKKVVEMVIDKGFEISNIDSIVCLERPKLSDKIDIMRKTISELVEIDIEDISIKATTTEKLGFEGRGEGISAYANVLIFKN